ncbi:MAG: hypothetical protein CG440_451, partial [Methanosaeta sp. NSM2]
MKSRNWLSASSLILLALLVLSSVQAKDEPEELNGEEVEIADILQNASAYEGKMVVIEGMIETECPSGCWFIVNDATGS